MNRKDEREEETFDYTDRLTGINNRVGFYRATRKLLQENQDINFVIVYWNVRRFKLINELFGREAGDSVLIQMAGTLKELFEEVTGTYGRLERDNFVLCFPEVLIRENFSVRSGNLTYAKEGTEYRFSSSYGIYRVEDRSLDVAAMVDRGRFAMESVKENYVKPYAYYDESMCNQLVMEQIMMSDCEKAIAGNQFEVYYQPICNAVDGTIAGAEALIRWMHPEKGMISPGSFIPLFERNSFISVLDRYVWDKVCHMLRRRMDGHRKVVPVSVNVSRVDFYNQNLCEDLQKIMNEYGIEPEMLRLEITESAYSDNPQCVLETVERLQRLGFHILMDDFGSGYSSLNTLKDLPVDLLKIDMKFMDDVDKGGKAAIILESIIRMTKWMNLKTVAEGVETEQILDFLRRVECDYIQGFYFYRPMPEAEFEELLNSPHLVADENERLWETKPAQYINTYSQALLRVFDKVYRLDYETGYMEVLHSTDDSMHVGEKLYFRNFFDKFKGKIITGRISEYSDIMRNKELLDTQLNKSRTGGISIEYKIESRDIDIRWVSATFFKIDNGAGKEEYLVCIRVFKERE